MALYYTPIPYNFLNDMGELSDAEFGRLIRACLTYSTVGEFPALCGNERFYLAMCKREIDRIVEAGEEASRKKSEAGKKGMAKRWHNSDVTNDNTDNTVITPDNKNNYININTNINTNSIEDTKVSLSDSSDLEEVRTAWNSMAAECNIPKIAKLVPNSTRGKQLKKRIQDYGIDEVLRAVHNITLSDFLVGENNRAWTITFDWFIKPNNFPKVLEGNYTNSTVTRHKENARKSFAELAEEMIQAEELAKGGEGDG